MENYVACHPLCVPYPPASQASSLSGEEPEAVQLVPQAFMDDLVIFLEGDPLEVLRDLSLATALCRKVCVCGSGSPHELRAWEDGGHGGASRQGQAPDSPVRPRALDDENGVPLLSIDDGGLPWLASTCAAK